MRFLFIAPVIFFAIFSSCKARQDSTLKSGKDIIKGNAQFDPDTNLWTVTCQPGKYHVQDGVKTCTPKLTGAELDHACEQVADGACGGGGSNQSVDSLGMVFVDRGSFAIGETEVTRGQWKAVIGSYPEDMQQLFAAHPDILNATNSSAADSSAAASESSTSSAGDNAIPSLVPESAGAATLSTKTLSTKSLVAPLPHMRDLTGWKDCNGATRVIRDDRHPVSCVSKSDAILFAKLLSDKNDGYVYLLPTMAQWTAAGEGQDGAPVQSNCGKGNDGRGTVPVKSFKQANGKCWKDVCDMIGNVGEWSSDGNETIILGGNWVSPQRRCTINDRGYFDAIASPGAYHGFRLIRVKSGNG